MTRSRAMSVLVLTAAGLSCLGQQPAGTPPGSAAGKEPAPLEPIRLDGTCFTRGGRRFISVGVNWVPAVKAMQWPYQWDPVSIEHDFASMHELGINTVRLDLVWAWFEPRPGDYNPEAFRQLHFLLSLANRYQIYLQPQLFIGGEVGDVQGGSQYRREPYQLAVRDIIRAGRIGKIVHIEWPILTGIGALVIAIWTVDGMSLPSSCCRKEGRGYAKAASLLLRSA